MKFSASQVTGTSIVVPAVTGDADWPGGGILEASDTGVLSKAAEVQYETKQLTTWFEKCMHPSECQKIIVRVYLGQYSTDSWFLVFEFKRKAHF